MSGPIEYVLVFEAIRRAQIRARIEQERQQRAERTREYLAESAAVAQERIAALQTARARRNQELLDRQRVQTQQAGERQQKAKRQIAESQPAALPEQELRGETPQAETKAQMKETQRSVEQAQIHQETSRLTKGLEEVTQWRQTLPMQDVVGQFQAEAASAWQQQADALLADCAAGLSVQEGLSRSQQLLAEAGKIVNEAETLHAKYETRNVLLREVIDSLKAIGFFVADPEFERPGDPSSPVLLKAIRGSEEMSACVDLSETIRSVWDGYEGEQCKSTFLDYLEQMKNRGVEVTATVPAVIERPILRQKGAKDMPRGQTQGHGS